jgi:hypothetical protein
VSNGAVVVPSRRSPRIATSLIAIAGVTGTLVAFSGGASVASTSRRASFCGAETYLVSTALDGSIPPGTWHTLKQTKETFQKLDSDLSLIVEDAPTKAFAALAKPLKGSFKLVLDSPRLLKAYWKMGVEVNASKSGAYGSAPPAAFEKQMATMSFITESGDYVWAVYSACPNIQSTSGQSKPFGDPAKFQATPAEVKAGVEAWEAMLGSVLMSRTRLNIPTLATMRVSVNRENTRDDGHYVALVGTPTLSKGIWYADYRVRAYGRTFEVFVSLPDTRSAVALSTKERVSNVVPLAS